VARLVIRSGEGELETMFGLLVYLESFSARRRNY
jgi:hypothetical protein